VYSLNQEVSEKGDTEKKSDKFTTSEDVTLFYCSYTLKKVFIPPRRISYFIPRKS
jgi:hypothetical protein